MRINLAGRQYPLAVAERVTYQEFNGLETGSFGIVAIPPGSYLLSDLVFAITESFVGPTTAAMVSTIDSSGAANLNIDLLGAPAPSVVTVAGWYPDGIRFRFTINKTGAAATAGAFSIRGSYVIDKRSNETQDDGRAP